MLIKHRVTMRVERRDSLKFAIIGLFRVVHQCNCMRDPNVMFFFVAAVARLMLKWNVRRRQFTPMVCYCEQPFSPDTCTIRHLWPKPRTRPWKFTIIPDEGRVHVERGDASDGSDESVDK